MVSVGDTRPWVDVGAARAASQRQRAFSALCSIALHVFGIGLCASVVVRQQVVPREVIRLTLLGDRGSGAQVASVVSGVPPSAVLPSAVEAPPVPLVVRKPAAMKPRVAKLPARRVEAAVTKPASVVAAPPPVDSAASTSAASGDSGDVGMGSGTGAGGSGSGNGDGAGSGRGGDRVQEYLAALRARIERSKRYPLLARRQGVEGRAAVAFQVTATGQVEQLRLADATHPLLGQAAMRAVEGAAPFPQLPSDIAGPPLQVEIGLRFTLEEP